MKNRVALMFAGLFPFISIALFAQETKTAEGAEDRVAGIHFAKGAAGGHPRTTSSPNMLYHNGPIMPAANVTAIYWGTTWSPTDEKITGLDVFYRGIGGSTYAATCNEYTDSKKNQVTSAISYQGHIIDSSPAPSNGNRTSVILAEVCKMIPRSQMVANAYYPVYIDNPRGTSNYCAWHSAGSCSGVTVQFAFFYKLDGDAGCDPQSTVTSNEGLAALANVSGHELSEARTDPRLNAWYDNGGGENADKCAWTFGTESLTFADGTQWKIQGNWSNKAYSAGTGYPNSSGQQGCIDGGHY